LTNGLDAHRRLAIRSAEHGIDRRQPLLDTPGKGERGEMLLEDAREPDDARPGLDDARGATIDADW
jgi:hypothetical protein